MEFLRPRLWPAWVFLLLGAALALGAAGCFLAPPPPRNATPVPNTQAPTATIPPSPTLAPPPTVVAAPAPTPAVPVGVAGLLGVADTVERVRPAVVSIVSEVVVQDFFGVSRGYGSGSGVIFDPSGLVLTNHHVVEGAINITVTLDDGRHFAAQLVGDDPLSDLAVLRLPGNGYPFVPLGKNVPVRVGEWVIAIGNALALPGGPTVTVGVISALGRTLEETQDVTLYDLIQTDAVINPGNSGGPLLNLQGQLVGINTAVLRGGNGSGPPIEGIGFAINMENATFVSDQLITQGRVRWPWLGALLADLAPETAAQVGLPVREGVVIRGVVTGGPSDQAGIRPGDILLFLNGRKVTSVSDLTRTLRQGLRPGQQVEVELFRSRATRKVTLTLGELPR